MDKVSLSCHALYLQVIVDNDKNSTKFKEDDEHRYNFLCNIKKKMTVYLNWKWTRDDSKHISNYPWLFYTVANSDVILSDREEETWFIQSGVLFSLKKKGLGTIDMLASHSPSVLLGNRVAEQQTKDVSKWALKALHVGGRCIKSKGWKGDIAG